MGFGGLLLRDRAIHRRDTNVGTLRRLLAPAVLDFGVAIVAVAFGSADTVVVAVGEAALRSLTTRKVRGLPQAHDSTILTRAAGAAGGVEESSCTELLLTNGLASTVDTQLPLGALDPITGIRYDALGVLTDLALRTDVAAVLTQRRVSDTVPRIAHLPISADDTFTGILHDALVGAVAEEPLRTNVTTILTE